MKIRTKLGIFPIALGTILIVLQLIILIISGSTIKNQVGNHLLTTAQSRANNIETVLQDYKNYIQTLAVGIPFTNVVDPQIDYIQKMTECNLRIERTIESNTDISRIRILNKNGIIIASSHEDIGFDLSTDSLFLKGNESVYIDEIHRSSYTKNLVLSISTPIFVRDIFSGVLIINFDMEKRLYEILINRTGLGKTGIIYLVNKDSYILNASSFVDGTISEKKMNSEQIDLFLLEHIGEALSPKMRFYR